MRSRLVAKALFLISTEKKFCMENAAVKLLDCILCRVIYANLCNLCIPEFMFSGQNTENADCLLIACYKIKQYGIQRFGLRFHNRKADTKLFLLMSLIFCSKNTPCIIETKDKIADRDEARLHISITRSLLEAILNTINCQKF